MNILKNIGKKKEATGALSGKTVTVSNLSFKCEAVIGEGGFATIYRAVLLPIDPLNREVFALKHFMLSGDPDAERDIQTEVAVMKALRHCPSILTMRAATFGSHEAYVLVDLCIGNLANYIIERGDQMSTGEVLSIFSSVCVAVQAMHSLNPPLAHRDVKAENILRHPSGRWVLCDFGSATDFQGILETPVEMSREEERIRKQTTPAYRAPEMWDLFTRQPLGPAVDIWALGCLLYLLSYGKLPFDGDAKLQVLNGAYKIPTSGAAGGGGVTRPRAVEQLISEMLAVDPLQRVGIDEVVTRVGELMPVVDKAVPRPGPVSITSVATPPPVVQKQQQQSVSVGQQGPMAAARNAHRPPPPVAAPQQHHQQQQQVQQQQQEKAGGGVDAAWSEGWATFGSGGPNSPTHTPAAAPAVAQPLTTSSKISSFKEQAAAAAATAAAAAATAAATPASPEDLIRLNSSRTTTVSTNTNTTPYTTMSAVQPTPAPPTATTTTNTTTVPPAQRQHQQQQQRPSSSGSTGSTSTATATTTTATVTKQLQNLGLNDIDDVRQLQEHAKVLEQLLESKTQEVDALKTQLNQQEREIHTLKSIGRQSTVETDKLRSEVMTLKAELEGLKSQVVVIKQQQQPARPSSAGAVVSPNTFVSKIPSPPPKLSSKSSRALSSQRSTSANLSSFPLTGDVSDMMTPMRPSGGSGGVLAARERDVGGSSSMRPMRPSGVANSSSAAAGRQQRGSQVKSGGSLEFDDLNPLI